MTIDEKIKQAAEKASLFCRCKGVICHGCETTIKFSFIDGANFLKSEMLADMQKLADALESAQKEIAELKDSNENIRSHLLSQTKISNQLLNEKEQLTAALKVAEDALEHIIEVQNFLGGSSVLQQDCEQALLEIQKIKKGLG